MAFVAVVSETIQVTGIRCERCVARLAGVLGGHEGLESATANLVGEVRLSWDDRVTTRELILDTLARGGFREALPAGE